MNQNRNMSRAWVPLIFTLGNMIDIIIFDFYLENLRASLGWFVCLFACLL